MRMLRFVRRSPDAWPSCRLHIPVTPPLGRIKATFALVHKPFSRCNSHYSTEEGHCRGDRCLGQGRSLCLCRPQAQGAREHRRPLILRKRPADAGGDCGARMEAADQIWCGQPRRHVPSLRGWPRKRKRTFCVKAALARARSGRAPAWDVDLDKPQDPAHIARARASRTSSPGFPPGPLA